MRNFETDRLVRDEVNPECRWVTEGEGTATRKYDGTCCLIKDGVFYADLLLRNGEGAIEPLSVRPSDAIAVALRTKSNIMVSSELLDEVGIDIPEQIANDVSAAGDQELEAFREFLDGINPEDFAG